LARINIAGVGIEYELIGDAGAPAIALTPGGRFPKDVPGIRAFADALAAGGRRVLIWDRPNSGASDLCIDGPSESQMQGEMLVALIRALDLGPTAVGGGSAGSRTSLFAAAHDPEAISHLLQWWVSGGTISLMSLGSNYCCDPAVAASMGGMAAATNSPLWAAYLQANPASREAFLALDPDAFIATMARWAEAFIPSTTAPIPGMTASALARLTMPTLIFRGNQRDLYHPAWMCERLAELVPHAELQDSPWTQDEFVARQVEAAKTGTGHFLDWPRLAPAILEFTGRSTGP
jgi:pimeloyl-ACP methyl ester carboxylesterase